MKQTDKLTIGHLALNTCETKRRISVSLHYALKGMQREITTNHEHCQTKERYKTFNSHFLSA